MLMLLMVLIVILLAFIAFPVLKQVIGLLIVILVVTFCIAAFIENQKREATNLVAGQAPTHTVVTDITDQAVFAVEHERRGETPIPLPRARPK
jgi:hypothetical protein